MLRTRKKVLALVLAMAMSLSLAVTASASYNTFDDQDKIENQEAVFLLNALDIVEGRETGDFDPAANINRAEAAKLVAALNLAGVPVPNAKGVSSFSDVLGDGSVAWANNYIEYCVSQGSVNGMGDGTFAPKANVTGVQFAKMLLGILGYEAAKEGYTGTNWMYNVNIDAVDAGLYKGLDIDATAALSRDDAAQMMYNALMAYTVIYLTNTTGAQENTFVTLLRDAYGAGIDWNFGIMTRIEYNTDKGEYTYKVGGKDFVTKTDYTDMLGMNVMYVLDGTDVLGFYAYDNGAVVTGLYGDYDYDELFKDKLIDTDFNANLFDVGNDHTYNLASANALGNVHDYYEYKLIDNDNNGKYDYLIVYPVGFETVTYVNSERVKTTVNYKYEDNTIAEGIAKDDVVAVSYDTSLKTVYVLEEIAAQTGVIKNVYGDNGSVYAIKIDGTTYDVCTNDRHVFDIAGTPDTWPGKTVEFYTINGYLVIMDEDTSLTRDYLLVTAIDGDYNADGYSVDATVLFGDGTTDVITIASLDGEDGEDIRTAILPYLEQTVGGDNGQLGYLARYEATDDGKYDLTSTYELDVIAGRVADLGFTATAANYSTPAPEYHAALNNTQEGYITVGSEVVRIADDALVFLVDTKGDDVVYSVKTGAEIANMTYPVASVNYVGYEADGFNYATLIFIQTELKYMSAEMTGIITSQPKYEANEYDSFIYFDLFDGKETKQVVCEIQDPTLFAAEKGDVIQFCVDNGKLEYCHFVKGFEAAVTAYDPALPEYSADMMLTFDGNEEHALPFDLAEESQIFYFDTENCVPAAGEITEAVAEGGVLYNNVFVVTDLAGDIVLMIVDPVQEEGITICDHNKF